MSFVPSQKSFDTRSDASRDWVLVNGDPKRRLLTLHGRLWRPGTAASDTLRWNSKTRNHVSRDSEEVSGSLAEVFVDVR